MKVVITGGAGFIGSNLAAALLRSGPAGGVATEVVVVDDLSTGSAANLDGLAVRLVEGTVLDPALLDEALAGADAVVHLAARASVPRSVADPMGSHLANATGTVEVLEAVRRATVTPYLVVASSSSVYGRGAPLPAHEELPPQPASPYAASKLATEAYALAWAGTYGIETLAVRFFNVYGPGQSPDHAYAAVVPAFVAAALAGRPLPVHGDGRQTRDFTFVGAVCALLVDALSRRVSSPRPVNVAFGGRVSLLELAAALGRVLGRELPMTHLEPRVGDVRDSQADTTQLHRLFPALAPVPLAEGLAATVEWFRQ